MMLSSSPSLYHHLRCFSTGTAQKMKSILKNYFGYSEFRPYQKEIIQKVLDRRDCLVVMATGSGKSLCYQVPPLVSGKTGVVVSPLISLMQDQVMSLKERGIKAEFLGSSQTDTSVQRKAEMGQFNILFMTPEKASYVPISFWSNLQKAGICLFAVDEAHCISEWGNDFRMEYKQLYKLRDVLLLSDVPFMGLTATATEKVRADIIGSLKMRDPFVSIGSFDRKNIFYGVKSFNRGVSFVDELVQEVSKYVASSGSTVIYCTTIKDVEQIFKSLREAGIRVGIYHGQMNNKARAESHRLFIKDEVDVMVATMAFGMGIDKPNIRQVIHYGCPKSLESYYQETGRCGRDGMPSTCWLYCTIGVFAKAEFYCGELQTEKLRKAVMESLMAAQHYCLLTTCRRKFLLGHFGENLAADNCGNCDNCIILKRERDMSTEAYLLMTCIKSLRGSWGLNMPVDILRGSQSKKVRDAQFDKLSIHGLGKDHSSNWWKALAYQLISSGFLVENVTDIYRTLSLSPKGENFLRSATYDYQPPLVLSETSKMHDDEEHISTSGEVEIKSFSTSKQEGLSEAETKLYHMLLEERMKLARGLGTAPYAICGDQTVKKIAFTRPSTKARLANVDGVNQHLVSTHGDHFLQIIERVSRQLDLSLDGESSIQTATTRKVYPLSSQPKRLSPSKFETWKMWHEDGLSIQKVASFPSRPAPIKEQTVIEYLLEAAREGCAMDWTRFCGDIGLTNEIFSAIEASIAKVGSREKIKFIKNELPEDITYSHIKACMTMHDCGISPEVLQRSNLISDTDKLVSNTSEVSKSSLQELLMGANHEVKTSAHNYVASCSPKRSEAASCNPLQCQGANLYELNDGDVHSEKRQKVIERMQQRVPY